ncbi:hypothetical protein ACFQ3Z_01865 [Streptomyces nogalater]
MGGAESGDASAEDGDVLAGGGGGSGLHGTRRQGEGAHRAPAPARNRLRVVPWCSVVMDTGG